MIYGSKFGDYLPTCWKALEGEKKIIEIYDKWMGRLDPQESYLHSKLVKAGLPPNEIGAEVMDHMGAGHETSGTTLTFLIEFLSKHPKIQATLHKELKDADVEDFATIDKLPYLEGVLQETFRLYASIPASQPRITPTSGADGLGYSIPAGTIISAQAYSLHRDPANFSDPEEFRPERWINADQKTRYAMMTFGKGTRGCIGEHIAITTIKITVALLYKGFESRKPDLVPISGDMGWKDYYMISPVGDTCSIVFGRD